MDESLSLIVLIMENTQDAGKGTPKYSDLRKRLQSSSGGVQVPSVLGLGLLLGGDAHLRSWREICRAPEFPLKGRGKRGSLEQAISF